MASNLVAAITELASWLVPGIALAGLAMDWVLQFFTERAKHARRVRDSQSDVRRDVKAHSELMSTYLTLRGAQEIAERRIADPNDREKFVALVREAMAGSIKKGEPIPAVRMRKATQPKRNEMLPSPARVRKDEPTR